MIFIDYVAIAAYLALTIGVGMHFKKRAESALSQFLIAGKGLSGPIFFGSLVGTLFTAYLYSGSCVPAYNYGLGFWFMLEIPIFLTMVPMFLFVAPVVGEKIPASIMTLPDMMEYLYDAKSRPIALVLSTLFSLSKGIFVQFAGIGLLLNILFGMDVFLGTILAGVMVLCYTMLSGFLSDVYVGAVSAVLKAIPVGLVAWLILSRESGMAGLLSRLPANLSQWNGGLPVTAILSYVLVGLGHYSDPCFFQKFYSVGNPRVARAWGLLANAFFLLLAACVVPIGLYTRVMNPPGPGVRPDQAALATYMKMLPAGLIGLFAVGFLSAAFSSAGSYLVSASANLSRDFYQRYLRPKASDREVIMASRIAMVFLVVLGISGTKLFPTIFDIYVWGYGLAISCLFVPAVLGVLWKTKPAPISGLVSMIVGSVFAAFWMVYGRQIAPGISFQLVGTPASLIAFLVANAMYGKKGAVQNG